MYATSLFGMAAALLALGGAVNATAYEAVLLAARQSNDEEAYCMPLSPFLRLHLILSPTDNTQK
jgi:hypothetical protein